MEIENRSWARGRRVLMASLVTLAAAGVLAADQAAAQDVKRGGTLGPGAAGRAAVLEPLYPGRQRFDLRDRASLRFAGRGGRDRPRPAARARRVPGRCRPTASPTPSRLRDAKFSDGSPVTVDDVVFSWGRLNDPSAAYQFLLKPVKSIEKVDDKPYEGDAERALCAIPVGGLDLRRGHREEVGLRGEPRRLRHKPVCSGPFMVESYERGTRVVLAEEPALLGEWAPTASRCPISIRSSCSTSQTPTPGCWACRTATTTSRPSSRSTKRRRLRPPRT